MITPQNIMRHELVGLIVQVAESSHQGFTGLEGKVVNETKNTLTLEDREGREKIIPKETATFHFKLPDGSTVEIEGKIIVSRPEDRIKKRFKKYG
ncbi:MAG: ribonuclease P protein component 1 [Methanobacteriaceae archaeon]|nr:ribonuclease P protein component 1 [Methanobacteriaceae archaeon]